MKDMWHWHFSMPERMFRTICQNKVVRIHHRYERIREEEEKCWMILEFADSGKFAIEDYDLFSKYFNICPNYRGLLSLTFMGAQALETLHKIDNINDKEQKEWEEEQKEWEEFIRLKAKFEG